MMLYITSKAKDAFAAEPTVSVFDVEVETFKGMVQLRGTTDTPEQAQRAGEIAFGVKGVKSIQNDILRTLWSGSRNTASFPFQHFCFFFLT